MNALKDNKLDSYRAIVNKEEKILEKMDPK